MRRPVLARELKERSPRKYALGSVFIPRNTETRNHEARNYEARNYKARNYEARNYDGPRAARGV